MSSSASGPPAVRGVIDALNDLDVVCRGAAWEVVCALAPPKQVQPWGVELVSLQDDRLGQPASVGYVVGALLAGVLLRGRGC